MNNNVPTTEHSTPIPTGKVETSVSAETLEEIYRKDPAILTCHERIKQIRIEEDARIAALKKHLDDLWKQAAEMKKVIKEKQGEYNRFVAGIRQKSKGQRVRVAGVKAQERRITTRKNVIKNKLERQAVREAKQNFRSHWRDKLRIAGTI